MPRLRRNAFAYVTDGPRLLLVRRPRDPAAGLRVPAGTIRDGERADEAVFREAREETGLSDPSLVRCLGERPREMGDVGLEETHHRFFYHLRCGGGPPE